MKAVVRTLFLIVLFKAFDSFPQQANIENRSWETNVSSSSNENIKLAETCDSSKCLPPKCRCSKIEFNDRVELKNIPQFVTITFDDAVTALNYDYIDKVFKNLRNPDGCNPSATFYFSHEYTDYTKINYLWSRGHEIALHSVTHGIGTTYWKEATVDVFIKEFGQQLEMVERFAQIDRQDIKGMRIPHLQVSGNNPFVAAKHLGLMYDSSWPTTIFTSPPLWPYTLDYKSSQDCPIGTCPDGAITGFWEYPLVSWKDLEGYKCAMLDACTIIPNDKKDLVEWMMSNFNRHYLSNRAPFGIFLHSAWFQKNEHYFEAFKEFIVRLNHMPDVYLVSTSQVIDYIRNPVDEKPFKACQNKRKSSCIPKMCQLRKIDSNDVRYMNVCNSCPAVYPWLDNPFGIKGDKSF